MSDRITLYSVTVLYKVEYNNIRLRHKTIFLSFCTLSKSKGMGIKMEKNINNLPLRDKINRYVAKIQSNRYLQAIMGGMMITMPVMIVGSLATIIKTLPINSYQSFLEKNNLSVIFDIPINITTNVNALVVAFVVAYALVKSFNENASVGGLLSLMAFLILTPLDSVVNEYGMTLLNIPMTWLGAQGMITAIITACIVGRFYVFIIQKNLVIKLPDSVPEFVSTSFMAIVPGSIILGLFSLISAAFTLTSFGSAHAMIYQLLQAPLSGFGSGIGSLVFLSVLSQFLWFFGIHGGMVVIMTVATILGPLDIVQMQAFAAGEPLPNITGLQFLLIFTSQVVLPLVLLCLIFARSQRYKLMGRVTLIPAIFGIDEPGIFGFPLIMNVKFFVPFILQGGLTLALAYGATILGIIPRISAVGYPMGTPIFLSGLTQGSWKIGAFQIFSVLIRMVLWFPFFIKADREEYAIELENNLSETTEAEGANKSLTESLKKEMA